MEVKLRGLDRYEVEAIQYDGTNSDEICQREKPIFNTISM